MTVTLNKLPFAFEIVGADRRASMQLQAWWQNIANTLISAFATGEANDATIQAAQASLATAVAQLQQALADITDISGQLTQFQPLDQTLTALSAISVDAGVIVQTNADTFVKRPVGVSAGTDILDRANADGRYCRQDQGTAPATLAYGGTTISNPPTQGEVQAVDAAVVAASNKIDAIIGLLQTVNVLI